jgi:hypothetical protein
LQHRERIWWAENQYDPLATLATDLVRLGGGGDRRVAASARAAPAARSSIPIVFTAGSLPVGVSLLQGCRPAREF